MVYPHGQPTHALFLTNLTFQLYIMYMLHDIKNLGAQHRLQPSHSSRGPCAIKYLRVPPTCEGVVARTVQLRLYKQQFP